MASNFSSYNNNSTKDVPRLETNNEASKVPETA